MSACIEIKPRPLDPIDFSSLFWVVLTVMAFSVLALLAEILIVFTLIKCSKMLGPFGRLLKRFLFDVKKGEEDLLTIHYSGKRKASNYNITNGPFTFQNQEFVEEYDL